MTNPVDELRKRFNAAAAKNVCATYLLQITGQGGGSWVTKIDNGSLSLLPLDGNKTPEVDCSISISKEDLELIMAGKLSAMTAALSGMLAIDGEIGLAMQLVPIFFDKESVI